MAWGTVNVDDQRMRFVMCVSPAGTAPATLWGAAGAASIPDRLSSNGYRGPLGGR